MLPPPDSSPARSPDEPEPFNPWDPTPVTVTAKQRQKWERLETPLNVRQVETHLIFGFFARHVPLIPVAGGLFILVTFGLLVAEVLHPEDFGRGLPALFLAGGGAAAFARASLRQQAIMGWIATKLGLAVLCIMVIPAALGLWLRDNRHGQQQLFFLGVIWLPGLEFIPKITPYQRYLTLARLILSVPCIFHLMQQSS